MESKESARIPRDVFMETFKYFKSNKPKPSLDRVITTDSDNRLLLFHRRDIIEDVRSKYLGLRSLKEWKAYSLKSNPGLILIRNPFTSLGQRFWIRKCLEIYPKKPNRTNIDVETHIDDWWSECHYSERNNSKLLKKLRWTTLGYHHNWDTKVYTEENKGVFPSELSELADIIAHYLGYEGFRAEAAIVNYYHMSSTLSAHTDHSEINLEAPLFSFSFGQSSIFLIGGQDKFINPIPILLNSGDIVIMSKEARLCYHAVPKILPSPTTPWNYQEDSGKMDFSAVKFKFIDYDVSSDFHRNIDNVEWSHFNNYICESRVNINVRQVLNENQNSLNDVI